nr:hypothetical protein [Hoylesella marshii]
MNKTKEKQKQTYVRPIIEVVPLDDACNLLQSSRPHARPGGDQGGSVNIENPTEDDDDTNISGAKHWGSVWEED